MVDEAPSPVRLATRPEDLTQLWHEAGLDPTRPMV
jgi:hypothetical protein